MTDLAPRPQRWSRAWTGPLDEQRPLLTLLRRRRTLRVGVVQTIYVAIGAVAGVTLPQVRRGPTVDAENVQPLLFGMAGGLISFVALVFSLLFLVVQFGNTTVSPRLTLFRDDPLVWHCFGFFAAVLVYCSAAGVRIGGQHGDVAAAVPAIAVLLVLVSLGLSRTLQMRALKLLQFNATMEEIRTRGETVLSRFYAAPADAKRPRRGELPPIVAEVRWPGPGTLLEQIDLPALVETARANDAVIELRVRIGDELRRGMVAAVVRAEHPADASGVTDAFSTGIDRTFVQDPLLAFRLLSDIGNRALSTAINDPATAVQAVGCVQDLLAMIADRRLDFGPINGPDGRPRVQLAFPTWDDFVAAGVDEIGHFGQALPTVRGRLRELLDDLSTLVPPDRIEPLEVRRAALEKPVRTAPGRHRADS